MFELESIITSGSAVKGLTLDTELVDQHLRDLGGFAVDSLHEDAVDHVQVVVEETFLLTYPIKRLEHSRYGLHIGLWIMLLSGHPMQYLLKILFLGIIQHLHYLRLVAFV